MKIPKTSHPELCLILIGLATRLIFAPFTKDPWDMNIWMNIGSAIYSGQNPYTLPTDALVYPPLWGIFCAISYLTYTLTTNPFIFYLTIKLPIITADILIAILLKKIVYNLTNDKTKARTAMLLYLFNPVTITFSSLWGMFDAIPTLFTLLSICYLSKADYLKSGISLGLGIGFKGFFPALLLPIFLYYIWKKDHTPINSLKYATYSTFIPVLISVPFLLDLSLSYTSSVIYHVGKTPQNFTYWFSLRLFSDIIGTPNLILQLGYYIFVPTFLCLYVFIAKKSAKTFSTEKNTPITKHLLILSMQIIFAFFITSCTVSEQYLIWALPLLILYITIYTTSLKLHYYLLSILNIIFVTLNVGPLFFTHIIRIPSWWTGFQYSWSSLVLMALTGTSFSITCAVIFIKLIKDSNYL